MKLNQRIFHNNFESGFSLTGAMISVGFIGLIAVGSMKMMHNQSSSKKSIQNRQARYALKRMLIGQVSCSESFSDETCDAGEIMELFNEEGETVIKNTGKGTRLGGFAVRAECNDSGDGIIVKAALLKKTSSIYSSKKSDFIADPLTKRAVTWDDDATLVFGRKLPICPDINATPSISKSCRRKRSRAFDKDFVVWCPTDYPKLYSCSQIGAQAPGSGEEDSFEPTSSTCKDGSTCSSPRRTNLGGNGMYYERVKKPGGPDFVEGCWLYDKKHKHKPHKADIMCCK